MNGIAKKSSLKRYAAREAISYHKEGDIIGLSSTADANTHTESTLFFINSTLSSLNVRLNICSFTGMNGMLLESDLSNIPKWERGTWKGLCVHAPKDNSESF